MTLYVQCTLPAGLPLSYCVSCVYSHVHTRRLSAEDVMNRELKYLYPITRVASIVRQLRTTAHSAFLIVTPVEVDKLPEKPQTMVNHTPQLYSKKGFRDKRFSTDSGTCVTCTYILAWVVVVSFPDPTRIFVCNWVWE